MFLVEDKPSLVFTWEDPRKAGYKGSVVEDVALEYNVDDVDSWPDGDACPETCVGLDPEKPKHYKVFKYRNELRRAQYQPVEGNVVVLDWSDYLRLRHPDQLGEEQWFEQLDKLDEAARRRRQQVQEPDAPADKSRDQVAAWVAKRHFLVDSGISEVWYLPQGSPPEDIRFLEVNDRIAGPDGNAEAIDFGLDIEGAQFRLLVADVTSEQLDQIKRGSSRLPPGWSLEGRTVWRRGA